MKKILLIIFVLTAQLGTAQDFAYLMKFKINGQVSHGDTKAQVISKLGTPTKQTTEFNEMDEVDMLVLHYGESMVYLENNEVKSFQIKDSSLYLTYDNLTLRIGDSIDKLKKAFPKSYNKGKSRPTHPHFGSSIHLDLKTMSDIIIDRYINIEFNPQTLRITGMIHGRP